MYRILNRPEVKSSEVMRSHGLRKSKVNYNSREYVVGHRHSRGLDVHYDRMTEEDRLIEYTKAIPLLTIDPLTKLQTKVKELESERLKNMDQYYEEWLE